MHALALALIAAALAIPGSVHAQSAPREVNITTDSAPGWLPTEAQEAALLRTAQDYFDALEAGDPARAYAMMTPAHRAERSLAQFFTHSNRARERAGPIRARRFVRITWTKDPAQAPYPGIYAAIDIAARYARVDRECGYVVWYQRPEGGVFKLMRIETNQIDNITAADIVAQKGQAELDRIWKQLSGNCPNYAPAP